MPTEQLRPVLIIALCLVLFLMWQAWLRDYGPKPGAGEQATSPVTATSPGQATTGPDVPVVPEEPADERPAGIDEPSASTAAPADAGDGIVVVTDTVRAVVDPKGGTLRHLDLLRYPVSIDKKDEPFTLLASGGQNVFLAQSGLLGERGAPNHHAVFEAEKARYELADGEDRLDVVLRWRGDDGLRVDKVITFRRDSYLVTVAYRIRNDGTTPWKGRMYGQFQRMLDEASQSRGLGTIYTYTGGVLSSADKPYEKIDFEDMAAEIERTVDGGWLAMIQHYFAGAWIPEAGVPNHYYSKELRGARYVLGLVTPSQVVAPGASETIHLDLFVGPKIQKRLEAAAPGLERTVDYGWLFFIAEPLYWALQYIQGWVVNWGWSIIILTILIKLVFFHLSAASYKSMARMRKLQPKIVALRERFGDDKQKLNQAMMDIYKKEKINPLGGCLPIVVQIPVFIALYWVLLETVELRQAEFMFWLKDLSTHDPFFVLPVLMGASMFVQQRLNPTPPDPIQAKIMMALPIVFTVFFLWFPSGLVLYWLVNNVLSIAQQWVITRRIAPNT